MKGGIVMILSNLWMKLFGTTTLLGVDMGFWVAMAAVALVVVLMNVIFWKMKPKRKTE